MAELCKPTHMDLGLMNEVLEHLGKATGTGGTARARGCRGTKFSAIHFSELDLTKFYLTLASYVFKSISIVPSQACESIEHYRLDIESRSCLCRGYLCHPSFFHSLAEPVGASRPVRKCPAERTWAGATWRIRAAPVDCCHAAHRASGPIA